MAAGEVDGCDTEARGRFLGAAVVEHPAWRGASGRRDDTDRPAREGGDLVRAEVAATPIDTALAAAPGTEDGAEIAETMALLERLAVRRSPGRPPTASAQSAP
ncbi:hypothetical protein [Streptomyces aureus]